MRELSKEESELAAELFKPTDRPPPHKGEGNTHLTIRFDPQVGVVYWGPHARDRRIRMPGAAVLSYVLDTKGKKPVQSLLVRTGDKRKWKGTVKPGTDVVVLRAVTK